ncbi:DUF456 domain-containing protein [Paenibacillus ehimensis]|uniref:DUF456 domain-containing protein n=1 Tax=Paenibacillus ehimensis TaxID=79264 RepID=UPI0004700BE8|nr:DUF456 domain-containing protein [Paenibacillus ehimensis]
MATVSQSLQVYNEVSQAVVVFDQNMQGAMSNAEKKILSLFGSLQRIEGLLEDILRVATRIKVSPDGAEGMQQAFTKINNQGEQLVKLVDNINKKMEKSESLVDKIKKKAASIFNLQNGKELIQATIGKSMEQQSQKDMFIARAGNDDTGTAMFMKFKKEALDAGEDVSEYLSGSLSFMSVTKNADQISKLNNIAQRLALFDPEKKGLKANAQAIKDVLSGDTASMDSMAKRFGIDKNQVKDMKLDKLLEKGDTGGVITALEKLLDKNKMGQGPYDKMSKTPKEQVVTLKNNFSNFLAQTGQAALAAFLPAITKINEAFQSGKFQSFFDSLSAGLYLIASVAESVVGFLVNHFGIVQNVLVALGIGLLVLAGIWLIQWFSALWPVFLVIGAIFLLLEILNYFGISTSEVIGFIVGEFLGMFANIQNMVAVHWNMFVAFAEFLANVLKDPAYAIQKLFYDVFINLHEYFVNFFEDCRKGINWLIEKINAVTGTEIPIIPKVEMPLDKLKPKTDKDVVDYSDRRMGQKSVFDSIGQGQEFMGKIMNVGKDNFNKEKVGEQIKKWTNSPMYFPPNKQPSSQIPNINRVNEIGQVNNTVEVAGEDLEVMRDLAEIQSIQNFVSLTPTVQVTTGDIHQSTDVNEMIKSIEQVMSREIANSAQGVYA